MTIYFLRVRVIYFFSHLVRDLVWCCERVWKETRDEDEGDDRRPGARGPGPRQRGSTYV